MPSRFDPCIDADALRSAIAGGCARADPAIRADAEKHAARGATTDDDAARTGTGLRYVPTPGAAPRYLPSTAFQGALALRLATLELTLYGHCAYRTFGWERRREAVFSLRRAPWWRRLLGLAPPMAITFDARGGPPVLGAAPAERRRPRRPADTVIRLDPAGQDALVLAHAGRIAARSPMAFFARRWRKDYAS